MKRATSYKTKQREAILSYIASLGELHITVNAIAENFKKTGSPIGVATIYRHLDKLVEEGKVRKYRMDGVAGACYQYIERIDDCKLHYHLKCGNCGILLHMQCNFLDELQRHVLQEHDFSINTNQMLFYGKCKNCTSMQE